MNPYEMLARDKKANAIFTVLRRAGVTLAEAHLADKNDWKMAAEAAHVAPPSDTTIGVIFALLERAEKEVVATTSEVLSQYDEGGFGSPFEDCIPAQQEADEAAAAERKAEDKWEDSQEYAGNRCPPRE